MPDAHSRGQMEDEVAGGRQLRHDLPVQDGVEHKPERGVCEMMLDILQPARGDGVENAYLVSPLEQGIDQVRANEARSSRYQYAHGSSIRRGPGNPGLVPPQARVCGASPKFDDGAKEVRPRPKRVCPSRRRADDTPP